MKTRSRYLIYGDHYIKWNKDIDDWDHSSEFVGTYSEANEHATKLYGKKYTIKIDR